MTLHTVAERVAERLPNMLGGLLGSLIVLSFLALYWLLGMLAESAYWMFAAYAWSMWSRDRIRR